MNQRFSTVKSSELLNEAQRESKQGQLAYRSSKGVRNGTGRRRSAGLTVAFIAMALGLSACGQKGDLYLPDEKPAQTKR